MENIYDIVSNILLQSLFIKLCSNTKFNLNVKYLTFKSYCYGEINVILKSKYFS